MTLTSTDKHATEAFEFYFRIRELNDTAAITALTLTEFSRHGFDYATCTVCPPSGASSPLPGILLNNRPSDYLENYAAQGHVAHDPVITHLRNSLRPYSWTDVKTTRSLSKREFNIIEEGRDFGVDDGLIVPIITGPGCLTVFSPCGRKPNLSERCRAAVEMIAVVSHQTLMRAKQAARRSEPETKPLSPREREVLSWVAVGKTDGEIAQILSISPTTVLYFVQSAQRKLNTFKRQVAVIEAMHRGEISI